MGTKKGKQFLSFLPDDRLADTGSTQQKQVLQVMEQDINSLLQMDIKSLLSLLDSNQSLRAFLDTYLLFWRRNYEVTKENPNKYKLKDLGILEDTQVDDLIILITKNMFILLLKLLSVGDEKDALVKTQRSQVIKRHRLFNLSQILDIIAIYGLENLKLTRTLIEQIIYIDVKKLHEIQGLGGQLSSSVQQLQKSYINIVESLDYNQEMFEAFQDVALYIQDLVFQIISLMLCLPWSTPLILYGTGGEPSEIINLFISLLQETVGGLTQNLSLLEQYSDQSNFIQGSKKNIYNKLKFTSASEQTTSKPPQQQSQINKFQKLRLVLEQAKNGILHLLYLLLYEGLIRIGKSLEDVNKKRRDSQEFVMVYQKCLEKVSKHQSSHLIALLLFIQGQDHYYQQQKQGQTQQQQKDVASSSKAHSAESYHQSICNSILASLQELFYIDKEIEQAILEGQIKLDNDQIDLLIQLGMDIKVPLKPQQEIDLQKIQDSGYTSKDSIEQIKDLFPQYGQGFIQKCLYTYKNDVQKVINSILEDSLTLELKNEDRTLVQWDPQPSKFQVEQQALNVGRKTAKFFDQRRQDIDDYTKQVAYQYQYQEEDEDLENQANQGQSGSAYFDQAQPSMFATANQDDDLLEYEDEYDDMLVDPTRGMKDLSIEFEQDIDKVNDYGHIKAQGAQNNYRDRQPYPQQQQHQQQQQPRQQQASKYNNYEDSRQGQRNYTQHNRQPQGQEYHNSNQHNNQSHHYSRTDNTHGVQQQEMNYANTQRSGQKQYEDQSSRTVYNKPQAQANNSQKSRGPQKQYYAFEGKVYNYKKEGAQQFDNIDNANAVARQQANKESVEALYGLGQGGNKASQHLPIPNQQNDLQQQQQQYQQQRQQSNNQQPKSQQESSLQQQQGHTNDTNEQAANQSSNGQANSSRQPGQRSGGRQQSNDYRFKDKNKAQFANHNRKQRAQQKYG